MLRYFIAFVLLISILIAGSYFARLELIQFAFNRFAPHGIFLKRITGLQVGPDSLSIDTIELELGAHKSKQSIKGIKLDYLLRSGSIQALHIQHASVFLTEFAETEGASPPILLDEVLDFLINQPVKLLEIEKLDLTDIGHSVTLQFQTSKDRSTLHITEGHYETSLQLLHQDIENARISWQLANRNRSIVNLNFALKRINNRFRLTGSQQIHLRPLVSFMLQHIKSPPKFINSIDGILSIDVKTELDNNLRNVLSFPVELRLRTDSKISFIYQKRHDPMFDLEVNLTMPAPLDLLVKNAEQPQLDVSASQIDIGIREKNNRAFFKAKLSKVFCYWQKKLQCSMNTVGDLNIPVLMLGRNELRNLSGHISGRLGIDGNQLSLQVNPSDLFKVQSLRLKEFRMRSLTQGKLNYQWDTGRIRYKQKRVNATLQYMDTPKLNLASNLELSQIDITYQKTLSIAMNIMSQQIKLKLSGQSLPDFGFRSNLDLVHDRLDLNGQLLSDKDTKLLQFSAHHHLRHKSGEARILSDLVFSKSDRTLSNYFYSWPYDWDLRSGQCKASGTLIWQTGKNADDLRGGFQHACDQLSGMYRDIAFFGMDSDVSGTYTTNNSVVSNRTGKATIEEFDIGLPIRNIGLDFVFNAQENAVTVQRFGAELLGGTVRTDDFVYRTNREKNALLLLVDNLQVKDVVSLANLDNVDADGALNGKMPVSFTSTGLRIENGLLEAKKPGGVIRYLPDVTAATTTETDQTLKIVTDALSNYHYETLRIETQYNENGDLHLKMKMQGMNPDMNDGQPINLNLNVTDNIPTLLKSLQSSRMITDVFERKYGEH